jgi:hypothetical protein
VPPRVAASIGVSGTTDVKAHAHFLEEAPRTAKRAPAMALAPPDETACGEFVA